MNKMTKETVVMRPNDTNLLSVLRDGKSIYYDKTFEEIKEEHPEAIHLSWDEALERITRNEDAQLITPWEEITKEEYWDNLEVLPPEKWQRGEVSIFRMSEYCKSNITRHYASYKSRYFTSQRRTTPTYDEMIKEIKELCND